MRLKAWHWRLVLFVFASPVLFILAVYRMVRHVRFVRVARQPSVECRNCGVQIMLLGFWRFRLQQAGENTLYLSKQAGVVLNRAGEIVTSYGAKEFRSRSLIPAVAALHELDAK